MRSDADSASKGAAELSSCSDWCAKVLWSGEKALLMEAGGNLDGSVSGKSAPDVSANLRHVSSSGRSVTSNSIISSNSVYKADSSTAMHYKGSSSHGAAQRDGTVDASSNSHSQSRSVTGSSSDGVTTESHGQSHHVGGSNSVTSAAEKDRSMGEFGSRETRTTSFEDGSVSHFGGTESRNMEAKSANSGWSSDEDEMENKIKVKVCACLIFCVLCVCMWVCVCVCVCCVCVCVCTGHRTKMSWKIKSK